MFKVVRFLPVVLILSLFSCGDSSFLLTLSNSENAVTIRTSIDNGAILGPDSGASLDISLDYDETVVVPTRLEIAFLDGHDQEISEPQIIEGNNLNKPLPSVSIASPEESMYSVRIRAFDIEGVLLKEDRVSFFYFDKPLLIKGLTAYPNVFTPGGQGLIVPDADAPGTCWVRWSIDNEIIEEGSLSQYADGFKWQAPLLEGVYGLRMELFPVEPKYASNGTFPFTSPVRSDIEIFVSKSVGPDPGDLYPQESYSTLIHFKGVVKDEGTNQADIITIGSPEIRREGDKLGFYLSRGSGYRINRNVLPVIDGFIQPFSVTFSYYLNERQIDSYFLSITDGRNEFFSIKTDTTGILMAELFQSGSSINDISGIAPEDYNEVTLSVVPGIDKIVFLWYGDGTLLSVKSFEYKPELVKSSYISLIGADNGFEGLLDEFGIYDKDVKGRSNIDDNIFKRRIHRKYNSDKIIAAYGFDGLYYSGGNDRSVYVSDGSLHLGSNSVFQFLKTDTNFSHLYIDVDFEEISDDTEFEISFPENKSVESLHINLSDLSLSGDKNKYLGIELNIESGFLSLSSQGKLISKKFLKLHSPVNLELLNKSENSITRIASLMVRREEKRVVKAPAQKNGSEL